MLPGMMPGFMPGAFPGMLPASGPVAGHAILERGRAPPPEAPPPPPLDPAVQKLCDHFEIDSSCAVKLNDEMAKRKDTKEADIEGLWELLEDVGSPQCLLEIKVREMVAGQFVGKVKADREVAALALNFDLDEDVAALLNQIVARRASRKGEDLVRMESILEHSRDPAETASLLAQRLLDGDLQSLPDMGEVIDVVKKFKLDAEAKQKLWEVVVERADESSRVLGRLEVYLEACRRPSAAVLALSGRLLAGGDVPEEPPRDDDDRDRERPRDRGYDRDRSSGYNSRQRSRSRRPSSNSRSRR